MKKSNIFIFVIVVAILGMFIMAIKIDLSKDSTTTNNVPEIENQVCTLESECTARGSVLDAVDENMQKISLEESLEHLDETCALFFSFEDCPWCYDAISVLNEVYNKYGVPTYYVYIERNEREETNPTYLEVKEKLGVEDKMYVPYFAVLKEGEVLGSNVGTVSGHEKVDGVLPAINDMQKAELKMIFKTLYEKITD